MSQECECLFWKKRAPRERDRGMTEIEKGLPLQKPKGIQRVTVRDNRERMKARGWREKGHVPF